jgi:S-adenosylmethionine:tRNA ribosyltransferase-isomerase
LRTELLDYPLPAELIARHPAPEREQARLCVVRRAGCEHAHVRDLERLLAPGALLVVNDTRVLPARLRGRRLPGGGRVELLLVERAPGEGDGWLALGKPGRRLRAGVELELGASLRGSVEGTTEGLLRVRLWAHDGIGVEAALEQDGEVPLPPYLGRPAEAADRERYQTVYARVPGAVAAPTAGLHFSEALLARLRARGVEITAVTLHVGPGTFLPVAAADLDEHPMHAEPFEIAAEAAEAIGRARARGAPVVAVGTTVVRALESAAREDGSLAASRGATRLLIQPGHRFKVVDALLTNFHLPRSTLLALVYAFAGRERVRAAYREAIALGYRFYSYGDAMLLAPDARGPATPAERA